MTATAAVRSGPAVHPRGASVLLGLSAAACTGALVSTASFLSGLLHADPAVLRLGERDVSGSAAVGYLFIAAALLVAAIASERRWTTQLAAMRPPPIVVVDPADGDPGGPADRAGILWGPRPSRRDRLRRSLRASGLIELRAAWTQAPDATFDAVARAWPILAIMTGVLGTTALVALFYGDGAVVRMGVRIGLIAEWLLVLSILVGWALRRRLGGLVQRRAVLALIGQPEAQVRPDWRFRRSALIAVPVLVALGAGLAATAAPTADSSTGCVGGQTGCLFVTVPYDRAHPEDGRTIDIVYRVAESTGGSHKLLVVAVGGPGGSGLAEMTASRLDEIDPSIRSAYDIVFFDQRGVGASDGLHCPGASGDRHSVKSVSERQAEAQAFATACVRETGHAPADMAVYGSSQAADDIDSIRAALGVDRFVLYGESYGTRLAQAYAARHPDRLDALILDGAIDPASDGQTFWTESAAGFDASLSATMTECLVDDQCKLDFAGRDPLDTVRTMLFPSGDGARINLPTATGLQTEVVSRNELAGEIEDSLYTEHGRAYLQRAMAAYARGDTTMLGRLVLVDRETSPESRGSVGATDSSLSVASYFAIECADYDYPAGDLGAAAFVTARDGAREAGRILDTAITQDLPCAYWPVHGPPLGPTATPNVPTLVLAATTDPVTPPGNAERIAARLPNAALVLSIGGPHVTWRGEAHCVTTAVEGLLLGDKLPGLRATCPDRVSESYVRLSPPTTYSMSALDAFDDVYTETYELPEFDAWDGTDPLTVGCTYGGTVEIRSAGGRAPITYDFDKCGFFSNTALTGTATYDPTNGEFRYEGSAGTDRLTFTEDSNGDRVVDGTWFGKTVHDRD